MTDEIRDILYKKGYERLEISKEKWENAPKFHSVARQMYLGGFIRSKLMPWILYDVYYSYGWMFKNGKFVEQYGIWVPKKFLKKSHQMKVSQDYLAKILQEHLR